MKDDDNDSREDNDEDIKIRCLGIKDKSNFKNN